jgi:hypothetical protein
MKPIKQYNPDPEEPSNQMAIRCFVTGKRSKWLNAVKEGWKWEYIDGKTRFYSPEGIKLK